MASAECPVASCTINFAKVFRVKAVSIGPVSHRRGRSRFLTEHHSRTVPGLSLLLPRPPRVDLGLMLSVHLERLAPQLIVRSLLRRHIGLRSKPF